MKTKELMKKLRAMSKDNDPEVFIAIEGSPRLRCCTAFLEQNGKLDVTKCDTLTDVVNVSKHLSKYSAPLVDVSDEIAVTILAKNEAKDACRVKVVAECSDSFYITKCDDEFDI